MSFGSQLMLSPRQGSRSERLELVGLIVQRAIEFAKRGFGPNFVYEDCVNGETVPAAQAFIRDDKSGLWHLRQDRLPADPTIKAVAVDRSRFFIETAPFDINAIEDMIREEMPEIILKRCAHGRRRGWYELRTGSSRSPLALLAPGSPERVPVEMGPRWLTTIH